MILKNQTNNKKINTIKIIIKKYNKVGWNNKVLTEIKNNKIITRNLKTTQTKINS